MSTTRVQLALNVDDVAAATAFYERMFGVAPHKVREGYANFAIEDPPLKLVLIEKPDVDAQLNHLGVEAETADDVATALQRFGAHHVSVRSVDYLFRASNPLTEKLLHRLG